MSGTALCLASGADDRLRRRLREPHRRPLPRRSAARHGRGADLEYRCCICEIAAPSTIEGRGYARRKTSIDEHRIVPGEARRQRDGTGDAVGAFQVTFGVRVRLGAVMGVRATPVDCSMLSVILPVRIDNADRLENLTAVSAYIRKFFNDAELILVESDSRPQIDPAFQHRFDQYHYISTTGPFSKSACMNAGLLLCTRPIVVFYDVDVFVHPQAIEWTIDLIRRHRFFVALPFNGTFVDISGNVRRQAIEELTVGDLADQSIAAVGKLPECEARIVDGGVFVADREVVTLEGGYNSNMVSYGWEDLEVLLRLERLGYPYCYSEKNLVHLAHARGPDSVKNEHFDKNKAEYIKVRGMNRSALRRYVDEALSIVHGEDVSGCRSTMRRRKSAATLSLRRLAGIASKIRSRLRHRL